MLGTSFVHLLPEVVEHAEEAGAQLWIFYTLSGASLMLSYFTFAIAIPRLQSYKSEEAVNETAPLHSSSPDIERVKDKGHSHSHEMPKEVSILFVFALAFHSFFAALIVGLQNNFEACLAIFIAIVAHKWGESWAMGLSIYHNEFSKWKSIFLISVPMMATVVGGVVGAVSIYAATNNVDAANLAVACTSAVSFGLFVFIAFVEIIMVEMMNGDDLAWKFVSTCFGFTLSIVLGVVFAE